MAVASSSARRKALINSGTRIGIAQNLMMDGMDPLQSRVASLEARIEEGEKLVREWELTPAGRNPQRQQHRQVHPASQLLLAAGSVITDPDLQPERLPCQGDRQRAGEIRLRRRRSRCSSSRETG